MPSTIGLIKVASAQEVMDDLRTEDDSGHQPSHRELMTDLARYIDDCWEEARRHKRRDEKRFRHAAYARRGEYPPEKLRQISQTGASTEYARVVANKSRILEAWLRDIFLSSERPWSVSATPSPDLPETDVNRVRNEIAQEMATLFAQGQTVDSMDLQQMMSDRFDLERMRKKQLADRRAERMEEVIADQLHEGGWEDAFGNFLAHLVTYPAAILKGPIFRHKERVNWEEVDGTHIPMIDRQITMQFEAPDPNNIYPAPGTETPQEGYIIEHLTVTESNLYSLIGVEGYDEAAIRAILDRADGKGLRWLDQAQTSSDTGSENNRSDVVRTAEHASFIDMLEFHGPIQGKKLRKWGMDNISDDHQYYEATVLYIDGEIIKAVLNEDPMGRRPYYKACYERVPGKFWGYSLYDALADVQGMGNAAIRSLCNNMAIASGPQVVVNTDRLPPGEDIRTMVPWQIWQIHDGPSNAGGQRAIDFYQPNSNVNELLTVLEKVYSMADDFSLIPRYMSGSDQVSGPARTATGLSMLLDAANKGLKSIVYDIDVHVMSMLLEQLFDHNMVYSDDESIKGDSRILARGVSSLMQLETIRMRRNEFLQITANPIDMGIVGTRGRASVLREMAKTLGMDVNQVVPPESQIAEQPVDPTGGQGQPAQLPSPSGEVLGDGSPVADTASPVGGMG